MPDLYAGRDPLDRARGVYRALNRFLDACCEWLLIEEHPFAPLTKFWIRGLQTFEGVPEVYPFALDLLDALGPGQRRELEWPPHDWPPRFLARLGDVAFQAREVILETWGWPVGLDQGYLRGLVEERRCTGFPTLQRTIAEARAEIERNVTPEARYQCFMDPPPFDRAIDLAKREQFDRIVRFQVDRLKRFEGIQLVGPLLAARDYLNSPAYLDYLRELTFSHINDLDAYERSVREEAERPADPERQLLRAESNEYQNRPLIGIQAARLHWNTLGELRESNDQLKASIIIRRRQERTWASNSAPLKKPSDPTETSIMGPVRRKGVEGDRFNPGSKALAAAYDLLKKGKRVSVSAACREAKVDRKNVCKLYPEIVKAIREMSAPGRTPPRGTWDGRSGNLEAFDDDL